MKDDINKKHHILLIEDNENDRFLMDEALRQTNQNTIIHSVENGQEGLRFLKKIDPYKDAPTPDLILLDLKTPIMNGHDFLRQAKADTQIKAIPVIVMTTSTDRRDIDLAYQLGANCYIPKPLHFEKFKMVIALIHNYWFGIAAHPDVENAREL